MNYKLDQGPAEEIIIEQAERFGKPLPEAMENAPELALGLQYYFEAFMELNTCRIEGGQIMFKDIVMFAEFYGLTRSEFEDTLYHVRRLDGEILKRSRDK